MCRQRCRYIDRGRAWSRPRQRDFTERQRRGVHVHMVETDALAAILAVPAAQALWLVNTKAKAAALKIKLFINETLNLSASLG